LQSPPYSTAHSDQCCSNRARCGRAPFAQASS
jgi:hypothetical protein